MKVWYKGEGVKFENSEDCFGESFGVASAPLDLAVITITARYPAEGYLYNAESDEMAYVVSGVGYLETKNGDRTELSTGSVVHIGTGERIAWCSDNMTLVVPCAPAFRTEQHFIEEVK